MVGSKCNNIAQVIQTTIRMNPTTVHLSVLYHMVSSVAQMVSGLITILNGKLKAEYADGQEATGTFN